MSKLLAALVYQEVFSRHYMITTKEAACLHAKALGQRRSATLLTIVTEPLGDILAWDKNIFYQCCL